MREFFRPLLASLSIALLAASVAAIASPATGARVPAALARLVAVAANPWQTPGLVGGLAPSSTC